MPVSRRRCRSGYKRSKVDRRKCVPSKSRSATRSRRAKSRSAKSRKTKSRSAKSRKTKSRSAKTRRSCRAGYRRSKVDRRMCVRSRSKSKSKRSRSVRRKRRCAKGSRRVKGKCVKKKCDDTDSDTSTSDAEAPVDAASASISPFGINASAPPAPVFFTASPASSSEEGDVVASGSPRTLAPPVRSSMPLGRFGPLARVAGRVARAAGLSEFRRS